MSGDGFQDLIEMRPIIRLPKENNNGNKGKIAIMGPKTKQRSRGVNGGGRRYTLLNLKGNEEYENDSDTPKVEV